MAIDLNLMEIPPPVLEFGGPGEFFDPKTGLREAGPFDVRFGAGHVSQVKVGFVGPVDVVRRATRWLERCRGHIPSGMESKAQYPDYPGFGRVFRAELVSDSRWQFVFDGEPDPLTLAMHIRNEDVQFAKVIDLYARGIEYLASRDLVPRPDVVVCCIPEQLQGYTVQKEVSAEERKAARAIERDRMQGQLGLFDNMEVEEQEEDLLFRDFRRALKARAMRAGVPIQLGTDRLFLDEQADQDPATRAWNSTVALYYKAGGIPWRLRTEGPETCFVGVSFHHFKTTERHLVRSSIAQAFSSDGEGFALRGESVPWDERQGRNVHLTRAQALRLGSSILAEYESRTGAPPRRIVLHKTSRFDRAEQEGFDEAFRSVPIVELINIMSTQFRLVRHGAYPPRRGTLCRVNGEAAYLFTTGYMPSIGTYPGGHIPAPARIESRNTLDVERASVDIMGLTRMNWNTASITNGQPVTLLFARRVGGIMAEWTLLEDRDPPSSFRYYM